MNFRFDNAALGLPAGWYVVPVSYAWCIWGKPRPPLPKPWKANVHRYGR